MKLDELVKAATTRVDTVRVVRTAVNPLLWLVGIVTTPSLVLAFAVGESWIRAAFFGLAVVPVLVTIAAYFTLMFRDPDRLQSEEYRLRQRALKMLYRKRTNPKIVDAAREISRMESLTGPLNDGDKK